jgi:hypothetical protein
MDIDDGKTVDTNFLADVEQVSTLLNCFLISSPTSQQNSSGLFCKYTMIHCKGWFTLPRLSL